MNNLRLLKVVFPIIFTPATLAFASPSNFDRTSGETHEQLVIVGSHIDDAFSDLGKITLTADDIASLAPNNFADVLRGLPGVDIMQQGGIGGLTFLSIRGGDPNFVVILIDGVKVNDPTNSRGGAFDLGTIDPAVIEKIDVYYGGYSVVHGSDALAGIISIKTKRLRSDKIGRIGLKAGSGDASGGSLNLGVALTGVDLNFNGSYHDNDNTPFGDAFHRSEFTTSLSSNDSENTHWHASVFYANGRANTFPEDSGGDRLAVIQLPEVRSFSQTNLSTQFQHLYNHQLSFTINTTYSKREENISNPGIAPGVLAAVPAIDSQTQYSRLDLKTTANYNPNPKIKLALGLTVANEDAKMDSIIDFGFPVSADYRLDRYNDAAFIETVLKPFKNIHLSAGIRFDRADKIHVTTNRLLTHYQLSNFSTISAHYSEGFKLPSFFALGHPFVGNPELKPEGSKNYEISFNQRFVNKKNKLRISLYQNQFTDLIDFDPIAFTNINRSKIRVQGAEIYLVFQINRQLSFSTQTSYNRIEVDDSDTVLRRRPEWKAGLQINYHPTKILQLTARATYNGQYYDSSIPTGMIKLPATNRLDISAKWHLLEDATVGISLSNVLDSHREESIGFRNNGRNLTATISVGF